MSERPPVVTFDSAPASGVINFGIGQPSADLLPVGLLRTATEAFMAATEPVGLNYGERQGDAGFRDALADFLTRHYRQDVSAASLFVTAGNSQALDFVCGHFAKPGDTVFVEEPSYFLAHQIFADHGLRVIGIPMDENGLIIDKLREQLSRHRPALLYTIPSYHNPGGQSLSGERRRNLAALSREYDFLIVADEVYQLLHYGKRPPAALGTLTEQGNILSMGSFSKIMAPGLRLGWIQTSSTLMQKLLGIGVINSGGSLNHFTSQVLRHAIELGLQDTWLLQLRETYRGRVECMDRALHHELNGLARWKRPGGGYFFWLELDSATDTTALRRRAGDFQTGFQPGEVFSCTGGLKNYLRLSFAHYREGEIKQGVERLGSLIRQ